MTQSNDPFAATAAAVGYLYQLRVALLRCTDLLESGLDWNVAIEAGDDIECVQDSGTGLWQLKHRADGTRVTDASTDLWKSLRIWATGVASGAIDLDTADLFLLTTAEAAAGSAAALLKPAFGGDRDPQAARPLLQQARERSTSKDNAAAYKAWDALAEPLQQRLLERIQVLDRAENIDAVGVRLEGRAALAVGHPYATSFLERLEGWFFQRVIAQLRTPSSGPVTGIEFDEAFGDRRNQFRPDNLPIDDDVLALPIQAADHTSKMFVQQLDLAGIGPARIRLAVRDWLRAFTQRSRWSDENLLRPGELGAYERRLKEEWEARFEGMREDLGDQAAEEAMTAEAKALYRWVEQDARIPIRSGCDEPFVTKGSFHMLSDDLKVGWHPDFEARLMTLLEPAEPRS